MLLLCLGLVGCTGAELAVIGAASSGFKTGMDVSRSGRIKLAVMAEGQQAVDAGVRACEQLGLTVDRVEQRGERSWVIDFHDRKDHMQVVIEERAPRLTQVRVNVGWFGPKAVAELVLKRIIAELELGGTQAGADAGWDDG